jgi:DNA-binding NarL/FixJ family response regulator
VPAREMAVSERPMQRQSTEPNTPFPTHPNRDRVLLADPQVLFQEGLRALLEPDFVVVGQVADGEALVSEALRLRPALVLTELRLAGLGGLEAARRVLAHCPGTRVVFLTAVEDDGLASEAFALGASGYLLKSSSAPEFLAGLRAAAQGRRALSARLAGGRPEALPALAAAHRGRLSPRAHEVVRLLAEGHSMKQAAAALGIATRTVAFHKYGAMQTLAIRSSAELVRFAVDSGMLDRRPHAGVA